jgi:hypothetical protein
MALIGPVFGQNGPFFGLLDSDDSPIIPVYRGHITLVFAFFRRKCKNKAHLGPN